MTTYTNFRGDGLDNPLSPNSGGATWHDVWRTCDGADVVESYDVAAKAIKWVGEREPETFCDPGGALRAIGEMSHA